MTFGSINISQIEIKPSAKDDFLKTITKEKKDKQPFLKPSAKGNFSRTITKER